MATNRHAYAAVTADDVTERWGQVRRWLGDGGGLTGHSDSGGTWLMTDAVDVHRASAILAAHARNSSAGKFIKHNRKRRLSRVAVAGGSYVVKEYLRPWGPLRWRSDTRGWLGIARLTCLGFPVARGLAWHRARHGPGCLILEDAGRRNLTDVLLSVSVESAQSLIRSAADLLAGMHGAGILHGDAKATNFVVAEPIAPDCPRMTLVDCDAVTHSPVDRGEKRLAECQRFSHSLPSIAGLDPVAVFWQAYQAQQTG